MKRAILVLLACSATSVGFAVASGQPVSACSCEVFTEQEAFDRADAVFTGELVEVVTPPGDTDSSPDVERFVFDVDVVYKGEAVDPQTIVTARDGATCGLEVHGPGPFLVYATLTDSIVTGAADDELYSNLCSGTRAVADAAVPAGFGAGQPPSAPAPSGSPSATDTSDKGWIVVAVVGVVGAALVAGVIALTARRRSPSPTP
jgi:hypothetical protein